MNGNHVLKNPNNALNVRGMVMPEEIKLDDLKNFLELSEVAKKIKGKMEEKDREGVISELWRLREQTKNKEVKKILLEAISKMGHVGE